MVEYWSNVELEKDSNRLFANTPFLHYSIKKVLRINAERSRNMADKVIIYGKSS